MKLKKAQMDPEIPTSSMADIAFLLIVFFMLTTVFSSNRGMSHILPPEAKVNTPDPAILIRVFPSGDFRMDGNSFTQSQFRRVYEYVGQKLQLNPNKPVILMTDPEARYGHMVAILDMLKKLESEMEPGSSLNLTLPSKSERALYVSANMM